LRRQPDIAVLREIRDAETGESLIGIFNTAVKVITTLHTNSAAHIPDRLEYFRIPAPYTASVCRLGKLSHQSDRRAYAGLLAGSRLSVKVCRKADRR
jgi:hypothetical protein